MSGLSILVIAGSERQGSLNQRLARAASTRLQALGHQTTAFSLRELQLPIYDGDIEAASGIPDSVDRMRQAMLDSDAVLVVTPEYNGFPTPLVINAFDWLSRIKDKAETPGGLSATAGKPVALLSAAPGPLGGLRSMNFLRQYLQMAFAMVVVPQQFALGRAGDAFDEADALKDETAAKSVDRVLHALVKLATALRTS
ncbi:NADPH-dependent FMN reductase [Piscinibacter sakaiensis]|uniref:NADPH-dependent FMN reductase n=1 Tax=Piscinibacter sakaiensis TaxID=1547922 RepID=UPI003AAA7B16